MWFLEGTESSTKSDMAKIGIMLSHAGKEVRDVYKTLQWEENRDDKKFDKVIAAFRSTVLLENISCTSDIRFGTSNNKKENLLTVISLESG